MAVSSQFGRNCRRAALPQIVRNCWPPWGRANSARQLGRKTRMVPIRQKAPASPKRRPRPHRPLVRKQVTIPSMRGPLQQTLSNRTAAASDATHSGKVLAVTRPAGSAPLLLQPLQQVLHLHLLGQRHHPLLVQLRHRLRPDFVRGGARPLGAVAAGQGVHVLPKGGCLEPHALDDLAEGQ